MRIKNYNYETCLKLKNPLGCFDEVSNFVKTSFNENKMSFLSDINIFNKYEVNDEVICVINNHSDSVCFFNKIYSSNIYIVSKGDVPKIYDKNGFEEIKRYFLNYKLSSKLKNELSNAKVVKKVNKI